MIAALLMVVLPILLGISLASKVRELSSSMASLAAFGIPIGIVLFTSTLFLLDYVTGAPSAAIVYLALAAFALITLLLDRDYLSKLYPHPLKGTVRKKPQNPRGTPPVSTLPLSVNIAILVLLVIIGSVFLKSLTFTSGSIYCSQNGCSDSLFHMGMGNSVALHHFPPPYPYTADVINVYPFMSDFYSALLNRFGIGLLASIIMPDLLLLSCIIIITALFIYRVSGDSFVSVSSLILFWFGGTGIVKLLSYPIKRYASAIVPSIVLLNLPTHGAGMAQTAYQLLQMSSVQITYWTSVIDSMLVLQRDLLLGLPLGITAIYLVYSTSFDAPKPKAGCAPSLAPMALSGIIAGLMPLVNPSTVIVLSSVFVCAIALEMLHTDLLTLARKWLPALAIFAALGLAELAFMTSQARQPNWSFFLTYPSFVYTGNIALTTLLIMSYIALFWIMVVGVPLAIAIPGILYSPKKAKLFFVPFFLLWAMISIYSPQPNPGDSNKVFIYVFLLLCIFAASTLRRMYASKKATVRLLSIGLIALAVYGYAFTYASDVLSSQLLVNPSQLAAAKFITSNTSTNAVFAESDYQTFNSVPATLGSRTTLLSYFRYVGIVYTYPVSEVKAANERIFSSGDCKDIRKFNISYIYLTPSPPTAMAPFEGKNFTKVYNSSNPTYDSITIYRAACS